MKRCPMCGETKALNEFYVRRRYTRRHGVRLDPSARCKECSKATTRTWYHANKEQANANARAYKLANPDKSRAAGLLARYGVTLAEWDARLAVQGGGCAVCGGSCPTGRRLGVDHDHTTGAVRGLLCGPCNRAIGYMGDDPARLREAANYLERTV